MCAILKHLNLIGSIDHVCLLYHVCVPISPPLTREIEMNS
jgi:hypothetical protein